MRPDSITRARDLRPYVGALAWTLGGLLAGAALILGGGRSAARPADVRLVPAPVADAAASAPRTKSIEDIRLGDRVAGRNPIREQVEAAEPDPKTWRTIALRMDKHGGQFLQIELLRPLAWIEAVAAEPGKAIRLDLPNMGAAGDAIVVLLGPCPEIESGEGAVVTGKFVHQADENSNVVELRLEGQSEATGVTANHPYWSADRREFVEAGDLREGEGVDTEFGVRRVVSVSSAGHRDILYNIETTEHVYRVGSIGTLVHNSCAGFNPSMRAALGWLESRGFDARRATPYASKWSDRLNGLRDGNKGYRIEFDQRSAGHINVFAGKDIGPHYTFTDNPADVAAILRQFFGG